MNEPIKNPRSERVTSLALSAVIGIAVTGYFVGIHDGVTQQDVSTDTFIWKANESPNQTPSGDSIRHTTSTLPATNYTNMRRRENGPTSQWTQRLDQIPQPVVDPVEIAKPDESQKEESLRTRAERRAFNGAPPIISHAVENTSDAACYACHGKGMTIGDRVANQMSHGFLANCTQCHAPPPAKPLERWVTPVDNKFDGIAAPIAGERAFPGAPPTIPHSTWMRENCLSCHGSEAGWAGLQSTHPWRTSCQQCHAPSAILNQAISGQVDFVPSIPVMSP